MSMYRRVIRIGEKSIGVTLPKQWLDSLNIGLGDLIEVKAVEDMLIIKPVVSEHGSSNTAVLSSGDSSDEAMRIIIAGYIEGFDDIMVKGPRESIRRAYQIIESKLPGSLILEGEEGIMVKVATSETNIDLKMVINSTSTILNAMFDKISTYLESSDSSLLDEAVSMDDQVDKLYFLALRTIKKLSFRDPKESIDDTIIVKNMEHVADALDRTAGTLKRMQKIEPECIKELNNRIKDVWSYTLRAINSYQSGSKEQALKVIMSREELLNRMFNLVRKPCGEEMAGIMHELQLIIALSVDIAEATFSNYVRSVTKRQPSKEINEDNSQLNES
ncbi:phosphate signaling complex PhoU family protein [Caldivirga sp. UBA161]|uniref:phosphate signaling complex PhoU family protein n=1 Tax=Caldivirga sp. UBA161 TaxID=1915569 RepID=UPI0025BB10DB|nr:phosphate uptake regulator PhoU [Caldivirga sp. UBA161]